MNLPSTWPGIVAFLCPAFFIGRREGPQSIAAQPQGVALAFKHCPDNPFGDQIARGLLVIRTIEASVSKLVPCPVESILKDAHGLGIKVSCTDSLWPSVHRSVTPNGLRLPRPIADATLRIRCSGGMTAAARPREGKIPPVVRTSITMMALPGQPAGRDRGRSGKLVRLRSIVQNQWKGTLSLSRLGRHHSASGLLSCDEEAGRDRGTPSAAGFTNWGLGSQCPVTTK